MYGRHLGSGPCQMLWVRSLPSLQILHCVKICCCSVNLELGGQLVAATNVESEGEVRRQRHGWWTQSTLKHLNSPTEACQKVWFGINSKEQFLHGPQAHLGGVQSFFQRWARLYKGPWGQPWLRFTSTCSQRSSWIQNKPECCNMF